MVTSIDKGFSGRGDEWHQITEVERWIQKPTQLSAWAKLISISLRNISHTEGAMSHAAYSELQKMVCSAKSSKPMEPWHFIHF